MAGFDISVLNGGKSLIDMQRLQQEFELKKAMAAQNMAIQQAQLQRALKPTLEDLAIQQLQNPLSGGNAVQAQQAVHPYSTMTKALNSGVVAAPMQAPSVAKVPVSSQGPQRLSMADLGGVPPIDESQLDGVLTEAMRTPAPKLNITSSVGGITDLGIQDDANDFKPNPNAYLNGSDQAAPPKILAGDEFLKTLDPQTAAVVKLIGDGREKSTSLISRMKPEQKLQIMSAVTKYNPDYNGNNFTAQGKFLAGPTGDKVRSLNVAVSHLNDTLSPLIDALGNGDIQSINRLGNWWASQTGDPAPTNFNSAKQIVADEIVKAVVNSGGGVGDREEAQKQIDAANSPAQLKGVIQTYTSLLAGQLHGFEQQYKATGGSNFDDKFISPETQSSLGGVKDVSSESEAMKLPIGTKFRLNGRTGTVK